MERVFELAGKTHYSNASFLVGTGLSALAFTSKLPVNIWKHMFLKGSIIAQLLGSISVPVFTNIIQDTVRK